MATLEYLERLQREHDERKRILDAYAHPVFEHDFVEQLALALANDPVVIAPYVHSYPQHVAALGGVGYPVVRVPCPEQDSYYRLLVAAHTTGKPVVVIEHDMVPRPGDVQALLDCPEPWCGFPYYHRYHKVKACLGLTKLDLFRQQRSLFDRVSHDWRYLDGVLEGVLWEKGYRIHEHYPLAEHLNPLVEVPGPGLDNSPEGLMLRSIFMARNPFEPGRAI